LSKKEYLNGLLPDDGNTRDNDVHTKQFTSSFLPGLICMQKCCGQKRSWKGAVEFHQNRPLWKTHYHRQQKEIWGAQIWQL